MNHCLLEVQVLDAPQLRYTQDNQIPIAEMTVQFDALRADDPPAQLSVVGWGNLASELSDRAQVGQRLLLEGRLRMTTVSRQDGSKGKKAEFSLVRLHHLAPGAAPQAAARTQDVRSPAPPPLRKAPPAAGEDSPVGAAAPAWNAAPLVPEPMELDDDEIPF
ncbi:MAG: single-stranded DNA-binding protein [Aphanocapsa feldmannii 277cV]|uniref:Single-stranded DNA-binding protein n=2 Tax=Aphanocapsa feldmannii TaxID=192050 RepID=A0A524RN34_9CHRO|nr:MAG: single-stranded DNA-binding protein [Aphanocapsa feldmannii 288cV]TGG92197.1 MAG: single-stranded DNA-binding protein [Aphanocapsa feldmannii 277cV]TGH20950.1 MAG: single-stranded DNA-binding protein [Aphanocapsa feldmannii 277cI]